MSHQLILFLIDKFSEILGTSAVEKKQPDVGAKPEVPSSGGAEKQQQHGAQEPEMDFPLKERLIKFQEKLVADIKPKISDKLLSPESTNQLRDLLYDFDDILEEWIAKEHPDGKKSLMSKCNPFKSPSLVSNYCNLFKSSSLSDRLRNLEKSLDDISKNIEADLDNISKNIEAEQLRPLPAEPSKGEESDYEWTTSCIDETKIYGWDDDVKEIVKELTKSENFNAVAIAGMYGSGKTALAQKVFMNETIKDSFPLRLWVCVSPYCSKIELLYRMLDNLGQEAEYIQNIVWGANAVKNSKDPKKSKIGVLLFILYLELLEIKYLIVFDDVRAPLPDGDDVGPKPDDHHVQKSDDDVDGPVPDAVRKPDDYWHRNLTLEPPEEGEWSDRLAYGLPKGNGSAVLVTCRREEDARMMVETGKIFLPKSLDVQQGWQLFERAFREGMGSSEGEHAMRIDEVKKLEAMKEQIVKKCNGLPLALVAAGRGLAQLKVDQDRVEIPEPAAPKEGAESDGSVAAEEGGSAESGSPPSDQEEAPEEHAEARVSAPEKITEPRDSSPESDGSGASGERTENGSSPSDQEEAPEEHAEDSGSAPEEITEARDSAPESDGSGASGERTESGSTENGSSPSDQEESPEEHAEDRDSAPDKHTEGQGSAPEEHTVGQGSAPEEHPEEIH